MLTPAFALAITLATLWGAAFHFALGGWDGADGAFLVGGMGSGFALGQFVGANAWEIPIGRSAPFRLFPASLWRHRLALVHTALPDWRRPFSCPLNRSARAGAPSLSVE